MAREDGGAGDGHGAEPVDDAACHVHGDHNGGTLDCSGHGQEQDPGCHIVEIAGAPGVPAGEGAAETVAELTSEDVDKKKQEDDWHADEQDGHRGVAQ